MPSPNYDRRLTATDASFLHLERSSCPMQIGAVAILDGDQTAEQFFANMEPRLPKIPRFRQRIVPEPYNLGHPTWQNDPDFDLSNHLFVHELPSPGTEEQLREAVRPVYSKPISRNKPLWELHLFRGLDGGKKCAVASSIHHAMVDGVGGNEILGNIYDIKPNQPLPPVQPFSADPIPESQKRLVDAVWDSSSTVVDAWANFSKEMVATTREIASPESRQARRALQKAWPKLLSPLKRLPFNRACSGERHLAWSEFSFSEFRAIRSRLGLTVNDVVLTVVAGAIARYAELHRQRTKGRTMRVMVPVNARPKSKEGQLGNEVSVLPANIPLGIADPIERANAISETMKELKESGIAYDLQRITNFFGGIVPAAYQHFFGSLFSPIQPAFNLTCTNVPGPQIPLYFNGLKMERYLPMVPVGHQVGLGIPIFTYNQAIVIGLTADARACPDVDKIKQFMDESLEELRIAAGVDRIEPIEITRPHQTNVAGDREQQRSTSDTNRNVSLPRKDVPLEPSVPVGSVPFSRNPG
jgi:diacylglycerol O-acyltransferase